MFVWRQPMHSSPFAPAERALDIRNMAIDSLILKTSHMQTTVMIPH